MAELAMTFALSKLGDAALNKLFELYKVKELVEPMHLELRLIKCFLSDTDSRCKRNDPLVKQWVNEVRDVAYRIEDAMDTFMVEIDESRPKSSGIFANITEIANKPIKSDEFCSKLKSIQRDLKTIYERRIDLGITASSSREEGSWVPFRPSKLSEIDVSEIVGLEFDRSHIMSHLLDRNITRRTVLSIVGSGGLGKTTLAQKVYKSSELEAHFNCRTWLCASQKFDLTDLCRKILYSIKSQSRKRKDQYIADEALFEKLRCSLSKKRYLIIIDDVWDSELWNRLKIILPDDQNGSRVIITTRRCDVAMEADCERAPYMLSYLNSDESLTLLFRKAYQSNTLMDCYPPDLIEVARKLTKKCGGLPLAIVVVGGILSRRERTYSAWSKVEQTIDWHNEDGKKCSQILALSYEDLPYHLKPCFLYFASFPEDYKISAKHLTRMWIAEGLIQTDGVGTLEDRAEIYLEELVQRCLVQVIEKSWNGYSKYCGVHDLLRDLAIHEAKADNFFSVISKAEDSSQQQTKKVLHRVAIHYTPFTDSGINTTNTRSLLCFGQYKLHCSGFKLLRVLMIERVHMGANEVNYEGWLEGLIHLKYLGCRHCGVLPRGFWLSSFRPLKYFETLDLVGTKISVFDEPHHSLWEVKTLRHVISGLRFIRAGPSNWEPLRDLQTLKLVLLEKYPKVGCVMNLRKLGIVLKEDTDFFKQCGSLERVWLALKVLLKQMEFLVSLAIKVCTVYTRCLPFGTDGTRELPCHETLQHMYLQGKWMERTVINVEMFPTNLTKLTIEKSQLIQDPMPVLERLQSLKILRLWRDSFVGTELICSTGGFPRLNHLELHCLCNLLNCEIKDGAMPILAQLEIGQCGNLKALPELQKVQTLRDLVIYQPSVELQERMQSEDQHKIEHISSVRVVDKPVWSPPDVFDLLVLK